MNDCTQPSSGEQSEKKKRRISGSHLEMICCGRVAKKSIRKQYELRLRHSCQPVVSAVTKATTYFL